MEYVLLIVGAILVFQSFSIVRWLTNLYNIIAIQNNTNRALLLIQMNSKEYKDNKETQEGIEYLVNEEAKNYLKGIKI